MSLRATARAIVHAVLLSPLSVAGQAALLRLASRIGGRTRPEVATHTERFVVVKLDRIGDFVLVTPLLRELRRGSPGAWITLVVSESIAPLARPCPHVNEVLTVPARFLGASGLLRQWRAWRSLAWQHLLPLRPTHGLLPRWDVDLYEGHALLAFSGARRRIGYASDVTPERARRNGGADLLLTDVLRDSTGPHEVEKNLGLLRALGLPSSDNRLELWPVSPGRELVARLLPGREDHFIVALCPRSAEEIKDWPLPRFLAVVHHFAVRSRVTFVLIVGPEYAELSADPTVTALPNLVSLAGRLPLDETAALLGRCDLVLTVDTGLMHLAAAMRRPLVVVSGWSATASPGSHYSSVRFGPWRADHTLVAPPDDTPGPRRIDAVTVDQVIAAVAARLPAA